MFCENPCLSKRKKHGIISRYSCKWNSRNRKTEIGKISIEFGERKESYGIRTYQQSEGFESFVEGRKEGTCRGDAGSPD